MLHRIGTAALVAAVGLTLASRPAEACGCFAPPDPSVPIVQAGERILFAVNNGVVTAHIQIQYAGEAKDFGWLLPLPSVPTLKLGTEELFTQLIAATQPRYFVQTTFTGSCAQNRFLGAPTAGSSDSFADAGVAGGSPLVTESSIGPYDYAVLKADSREAMLSWLNTNRYFIPAGTEDAVGPYIQPGAYFLALRLKSGKSAGDIQPVVLTYPSALPMIPIILTSVAAQPNMGIQVWMLGAGRAIPRNYNHVLVNDAKIDWLNQARNYNDVVIAAVSETPEKHAFLTEYAGTSAVMVDRLDPAGRFGTTAALAALTNPADFVDYLFQNGFAPPSNSPFGGQVFALPPLTRSLVLAQLPMPAGLASQTNEDGWLRGLRFFLGEFRTQNPRLFEGWTPAFDPSALAAQLEEKVVRPALEAGALFRAHPKMTRLYTTLSPQDMTRDPVFSFNPSLPDVSRDHTAQLRVDCGLFGNQSNSPATLTTEQGWTMHLANTSSPLPTAVGPSALRIETLFEEGGPQVLTDNMPKISEKLGCGCSSVEALGFGLVALVGLLRRRRAS